MVHVIPLPLPQHDSLIKPSPFPLGLTTVYWPLSKMCLVILVLAYSSKTGRLHMATKR